MGRRVRQLILVVYGVYSVTLFAVVCSVALLPVATLPSLRARRLVARSAARWIFRLAGVRLRVQRTAAIGTRPCVVVANHASYLDGIVLCAALPPNFGFVIKREVTRAPLAHYFLRRIGAHFVERSDRHRGGVDARALLRAAARGESLAIFPEGTFRREPGLGAFRTGAFAAAAVGRLPVVPVTIEGSREILPAGAWLPRPGRLDVTIYPAIAPRSRGKAAMHYLADASRGVLLRVLNEPDLAARPVPSARALG